MLQKKITETTGRYERGQMPVINNDDFIEGERSEKDKGKSNRRKELEKVLDSRKEVVDENGKKTEITDKIKEAVLSNQVVAFKFLVAHGFIDINGDDEEVKKQTQKSLFEDSSVAEKWLQSGDDNGKDVDKEDHIGGKFDHIKVKDLKPIQAQIFVTKSIKFADNAEGDKKNMSWLLDPNDEKNKNLFTLVSSDGYIMDGHHRWLAAYLIDENSEMNCIVIDMKKDELIELTNKFTGAIGNIPNSDATNGKK